MTWVEGFVLLFGGAALGGFMRRGTRTGRAVMWVSLTILTILLVMFGREFISDLL